MASTKMKKNKINSETFSDISVEGKNKLGVEIPDREYTEPEQDIPNLVEQHFLPTGEYTAECTSCQYKDGKIIMGFNLPKYFDEEGKISENPTLQNGIKATRFYYTAYCCIKVIGITYGGFFAEQYDIATQYGKNTTTIKGKTFTIRVEEKKEITNPKFPLKVSLIE